MGKHAQLRSHRRTQRARIDAKNARSDFAYVERIRAEVEAQQREKLLAAIFETTIPEPPVAE